MKTDKPFQKSFACAGILFALFVLRLILFSQYALASRVGNIFGLCLLSALAAATWGLCSKKTWLWPRFAVTVFVLYFVFGSLVMAGKHAQYGTIKAIRAFAGNGDATAQFLLGAAYYQGDKAPQDFTEAAKWFRKAAAQGNDRAQAGLGVMYVNAQGVPEDYPEAFKWFRKAADQGNLTAYGFLGLMYAQGKGVPRDPVQAYQWLNLGAMGGDATAGKERDKLAREMSPEQLQEAKRLAKRFSPKNVAR